MLRQLPRLRRWLVSQLLSTSLGLAARIRELLQVEIGSLRCSRAFVPAKSLLAATRARRDGVCLVSRRPLMHESELVLARLRALHAYSMAASDRVDVCCAAGNRMVMSKSDNT